MAYRQLREDQFQKFAAEVRAPAPRARAAPATRPRRWAPPACPGARLSAPRPSTHAPARAPAQRTGNTGEFAKKVALETDASMKDITTTIDANKEKIITSLLQSVTTVSI